MAIHELVTKADRFKLYYFKSSTMEYFEIYDGVELIALIRPDVSPERRALFLFLSQLGKSRYR